jgi:hypothetical protein
LRLQTTFPHASPAAATQELGTWARRELHPTRLPCEIVELGRWRCTKIEHGPVDPLHSIDFAMDKNPSFSLTLKIEGVKTYSFFDTFLSFAGWCCVRDSSEVTSLRKRSGRLAWVYSKALVEENRNDR